DRSGITIENCPSFRWPARWSSWIDASRIQSSPFSSCGSRKKRKAKPTTMSAVSSAAVRLAKERLGNLVPRVRHELQLRRRLGERHRHDVVAAERGHLAPVALLHEVGRAEPEAQPEDAVAGGRCAAALDVAEHRRARLHPGALLDLLRN